MDEADGSGEIRKDILDKKDWALECEEAGKLLGQYVFIEPGHLQPSCYRPSVNKHKHCFALGLKS